VVKRQILDEQDGPMLKQGLQAINHTKLIVPRRIRERPDPERLKARFESFAENAF
jgi:putative restriction endonuclease